MKITLRAITDITPYESNPRQNDAAVTAVANSIREYGWRQPIVVDADGVVVAGHTRLKAAEQLGLEKVPVHVAEDLTPEQARAYRIADNQSASIAEWDFELLAFEIGELKDLEYDLDMLGFDADELARLLSGDAGVSEGETDADAVPEPPDEPVTQRGDLWLLDGHRLLCGDSGSVTDLDRLLDGTAIDLINMDPPYNVRVEPRSNNAIAAGLSSFAGSEKRHHQKFDVERHPEKSQPTTRKMRPKDRPLENDFVTDEAFDEMLLAWFGNAARVLKPGGSFYIWGGYANLGNYPGPLEACGLYFSQAVVWDKQHPVLTRKDFMGAFELCQPPDTLIECPSGSREISTLSDGDVVCAFDPERGQITTAEQARSIQVARRRYRGTLYGVSVEDRMTWCTDGHLFPARFKAESLEKWALVLVKRDTSWGLEHAKIGRLPSHLLTRGASEAWILSIHETDSEATAALERFEQIHQLPARFATDQETASTGEAIRIDRLARAILRSRGLHPLYPLLNRLLVDEDLRGLMYVRACNLLSHHMSLAIPDETQTVRWSPILDIEETDYDDDVYSLNVEELHTYIADGIVTHNCFYGWKQAPGSPHHFFGPNNATDLWNVKKVNPQSMIHLTEKPVELATRAIQYSSRPGEAVLDLFGGSGSTLIGCEQTGRTAFLMEIDPAYCDVIVQRWEAFTGKKAERVPANADAAETAPALAEAEGGA